MPKSSESKFRPAHAVLMVAVLFAFLPSALLAEEKPIAPLKIEDAVGAFLLAKEQLRGVPDAIVRPFFNSQALRCSPDSRSNVCLKA